MKKSLTAFMFLIVTSSLIAQEASAEAESFEGSISFFDIVAQSGMVGILIWILILSLIAVGLFLGIIGVVASANTETKQIPLAVKLQCLGFMALFILGLYGALTGTVNAFACMAMTGAGKAQYLAVSISQALYSWQFSLLGCLEYVFFLVISVSILHFKHKKIMDNDFSES